MSATETAPSTGSFEMSWQGKGIWRLRRVLWEREGVPLFTSRSRSRTSRAALLISSDCDLQSLWRPSRPLRERLAFGATSLSTGCRSYSRPQVGLRSVRTASRGRAGEIWLGWGRHSCFAADDAAICVNFRAGTRQPLFNSVPALSLHTLFAILHSAPSRTTPTYNPHSPFHTQPQLPQRVGWN